MDMKLPFALKIKIPSAKNKMHRVNPTGVKQGNYTIPYAVALVDEMRKQEISRGAHSQNSLKKVVKVSKIREDIARRKLKKGGLVRKIAQPLEFMKTSKFHPKTMLVLTDSFLEEVSGKVKPKNAFDIAGLLRKKVPSLPESMIQSYSNWVYSFIQKEENVERLIEFRKELKKE